jgi:hypothetical protein
VAGVVAGVTFVPFARHVNARPGPRVELQIVEPAENTLPSKMQKFSTSVPVIWTVVVCATPGAGIAAIADNATPTVHLRIESLNIGARNHSRTMMPILLGLQSGRHPPFEAAGRMV